MWLCIKWRSSNTRLFWPPSSPQPSRRRYQTVQFPGPQPTVCVLWQSRSLTTHPVSVELSSFDWLQSTVTNFWHVGSKHWLLSESNHQLLRSCVLIKPNTSCWLHVEDYLTDFHNCILFAAFYQLSIVPSLLSLVSAFYAECLSKKIQFNAHIWTKSKFLGMSIGVHNIGQGTQITASYTPKSEFLHIVQSQLQVDVIIFCSSGFRLCVVFGARWTLHPHLPQRIWQVCVCVFRVFICVILPLLNYHQCDMLTLSPSVQVDSDCAVGGAGWGVQHLLLQVGLQR